MSTSSNEISPPWSTFPDRFPQDRFWREGEGEAWALRVWLPYWESKTQDEKEEILEVSMAPTAWRKFYDPEIQRLLREADGPAGWLLRNNLTPGAKDTTPYISVSEDSEKPTPFLSSWIYLLLGGGVGLLYVAMKFLR